MFERSPHFSLEGVMNYASFFQEPLFQNFSHPPPSKTLLQWLFLFSEGRRSAFLKPRKWTKHVFSPPTVLFFCFLFLTFPSNLLAFEPTVIFKRVFVLKFAMLFPHPFFPLPLFYTIFKHSGRFFSLWSFHRVNANEEGFERKRSAY